MQGEFLEYRRRLPHWRLDGATYFVTWRLSRRQWNLLPAERSVIAGVIRHFESRQFDLVAYVVMDDHVHVLLTPYPGIRLERIVAGWKSYTAHRLTGEFRRKAPLWQDEYHDRIVRNDIELRRKWDYVRNNPRKRWPGIDLYPWLFAVGLGENYLRRG